MPLQLQHIYNSNINQSNNYLTIKLFTIAHIEHLIFVS